MMHFDDDGRSIISDYHARPPFASFLPGVAINVAHIMHSDEALLAVAFIFVVHMFNAHIRFDKFPVNKVMFSGKETEEELRYERPRQWGRMQADAEQAEELKVQ